MQRHQLHAIGVFVGLAVAGFQRRMGEEGRQRCHVLFAFLRGRLEAAGRGHQFLEVLHPRLTAFALLLLVMRDQTADADGMVDLLEQRQIGRVQFQPVDQVEEGAQRGGGPGR